MKPQESSSTSMVVNLPDASLQSIARDIQGLRTSMNTRIDDLDTSISATIERLIKTHLDKLKQNMDTKLDEMESRILALETREPKQLCQ